MRTAGDGWDACRPAILGRGGITLGRPRHERIRHISRHPGQALSSYRTGTWAWLLHRVSGLLILSYLYFHLFILSSILWPGGARTFNRVVGEVTTPPFILADLTLIAVVLYHALNGIRVILFDLNLFIAHQRAVFWVLMTAGGAIMLWASAALLPLAHL